MLQLVASAVAGCRRSFTRHLRHRTTTLATLLFAALVVQATYAQSVNAESSERPNIVLIMADDLGYECIGANGCRAYKTPVLDRMASDGVRFDACHSQPLCTPSRVKIMTGRYAFRNYIGFGKFDTREITFGRMLRDAGYRTCMVGKWQLGGDHTTPTQLGFDEYCLQNAIAPAKPFDRSTRGHERYWGYPVLVANGELYESPHRFGPDMISQYAVDFIRQEKDRPFFLYYPMILPHSPFTPSPLSTDGDKSGAKICELKYFKDMVEYVDLLVGRVLVALDQTGQRQNTVVMFTGDNGTTYPVKVTAPAPDGYPKVVGIDSVRHESQLPPGVRPTPRAGLWEGPLTETDSGHVPGGKDLMSERGTHVPLIVDWPRYGAAYRKLGNSCDDLVDFSDFFATVADLAGAKVPEDRVIDGVSFAPRLKGEGPGSREFIFCHYWGFGRNKEEARESVRDARWKLYDDGRFYDLKSDIEERSPLENLDADAGRAKRRLEKVFKQVKSAG